MNFVYEKHFENREVNNQIGLDFRSIRMLK